VGAVTLAILVATGVGALGYLWFCFMEMRNERLRVENDGIWQQKAKSWALKPEDGIRPVRKGF
jgi:hypothetical protein